MIFVKEWSHMLNFKHVRLVIVMQLKTFIYSIHKFDYYFRRFIRLLNKGNVCLDHFYTIKVEVIETNSYQN